MKCYIREMLLIGEKQKLAVAIPFSHTFNHTVCMDHSKQFGHISSEGSSLHSVSKHEESSLFASNHCSPLLR